MGVELIRQILQKRAQGEVGPVLKVDFTASMPEQDKLTLGQPLSDDPLEMYPLPVHPMLLE